MIVTPSTTINACTIRRARYAIKEPFQLGSAARQPGLFSLRAQAGAARGDNTAFVETLRPGCQGHRGAAANEAHRWGASGTCSLRTPSNESLPLGLVATRLSESERTILGDHPPITGRVARLT